MHTDLSSLYECLLLILRRWRRQVIFESKGEVVLLCWMQDSKLGSLRHQIAGRLNAHTQTDWAIEDQAKTWTQQAVPMMSEHSVHLTSLPIGFRIWLWWYICLLLLILMRWHRQVILESKGDKLSTSTECPLFCHPCIKMDPANRSSLYHWGSSHEGSGRHPRQHGGGRGRRFSKFTANSHRVCSLLRPSFCELIVNVMGHTDAKFRAAVIRHLAAIPT